MPLALNNINRGSREVLFYCIFLMMAMNMSERNLAYGRNVSVRTVK